MVINCKASNLSLGLNLVSHVASKSASLPILANVLLEVSNGLLKIKTTNLELAMWVIIRGKIEEEGSATVNAKILSDYLNLLPPEEVVTLKKTNETLFVESPSVKTTLQGLPATDFPLIPKVEGKTKITLPIKEFRVALNQVLFAVSTDEARPEINGALLNIENNKIILASTDSFRLSEKQLKPQQPINENIKKIIPLRAAQELARTLSMINEEEKITITIGENQLLYEISDVSLVSRIIEGQYPDYQQIIPTQNKTTVQINTTELTRAIKQASLFCKPGINDVQLFIKPNQLNISSTNSSIGEHQAALKGQTSGEPSGAIFNYRYLLEGLSAIGADEVVINLTGESTPATIKPIEKQDYVYVLMPIRQ